MKKNKFITYSLYAIGEIILIVVGILIAVQIDEGRKVRDKKTEELKTLLELKANLHQDQSDIEFNINYQYNSRDAARKLLKIIENDLPYDSSYNKLFSDAILFTTFVNSTSAYETLKSKGLDLISNDSLRLMVSVYYDQKIDYLLVSQDTNYRLLPDALQIHYPLFEKLDFTVAFKPWDFENIKKNKEYRSWLSFMVKVREVEAQQFEELKDMANKMTELIDSEISIMKNT